MNQRSCSHTRQQANPWWMVDLGGQYYVSYLKVTNRGDCCGKLGYFDHQVSLSCHVKCVEYRKIYTYVHIYIYTYIDIHTYK